MPNVYKSEVHESARDAFTTLMQDMVGIEVGRNRVMVDSPKLAHEILSDVIHKVEADPGAEDFGEVLADLRVRLNVPESVCEF